MPIDAEQVQALAEQNLGRRLAPADAAGVAGLLEATRQGLAAIPHRPELEPAIGSTPLRAPREAR